MAKITLTCGHRPRRGRPRELLGHRVYRCATCDEWRPRADAFVPEPDPPRGRAHGVGTGANAHGWADAIGELVDERMPLEFVFAAEPEPWRRALIERLGVSVVVDAHAPHPHVRRRGTA